MDADQVVCPFFGVVFERLKSLVYKDQLKKLGPLVKELKKLYKTFCKIKNFINDAERKQFDEEEEAVRFWLHELNDAAYEADDFFDDFEYEALQQLALEGAGSRSNNIIEQFHGRVQKLIEIFQDLVEECSELDLQKGKEKNVVISPDRISISLLSEPQVYGRDEDKEKLVMQLLGSAYLTLPEFRTRGSNYWAKLPTASQGPNDASSSSSEDPISVFPILGMGGVGKTTLAQLVYNDERVQDYFNYRSWVCVSDDFDIKRLMKVIVASIWGSECSLEDLEHLQRHLQKEVHGKRLLLVLDDLWEVSQEEWNKMMKFFEGGAQGSSIIVTTRMSTGASITSAFPSLRLNNLSDNDCWSLFKKYAFGPQNEEMPALVSIGKKIVKKCQGLPLAVKALGSLLSFQNDENEWVSVEGNAIWYLDNDILPALKLSYYHLPSTLKQCFVFCSIFPKDYEIDKEQLIQLWMANGLVRSRAKMELEDVGNVIFKELLWRSFFQDIEKDKDGEIRSCKMHDLVHDLAISMAGDEYFGEDAGIGKNITQRTRYMSLPIESKVPSTSILESMRRSSPLLRSLVLSNFKHTILKSESIFSDFMLLRALDLNFCGIEVIPYCIGELIHLRYLNLSGNPVTSLPESICYLRNMQTLILSRCSKLESLPKNFGNMSNLRHLDIEGCDDHLAQECSKLKLEKGKEKSMVISSDRRTDSLLTEPQVNTRDEDCEKLVDQLLGSSQENISVFSAGWCIRRVPTKFREINEHAYTPEIISIGPFHRDQIHLKGMEVHKLQYMNSLLSRFGDRTTKLEECFEAISRLEDEARKCYSEPIKLNKEEFVEMMIVDSLFIIELFCKNVREELRDKDDPVFNNVWGMASLVRDLILLENQLPMLVLERLFNITMASQQGGKRLSELAIRFFNPLMQREESVLVKYFETGGDHLLDILSKTFFDFPSQQLPHGVKSVQVPVPSVLMKREEIVVERAPSQGEITSSTVKSEPEPEFKDVPSLTKLRDSGVKFKKGNNTLSFLDINFSNGVIEIPPILIRDQNFSFIRNVIAYEQGLVGHPAQMTSYVVLMNNLVQTSNDVAFLREHGIIRNYLSDDELVSSQFQKLHNEINLANFHHSKLCIDVTAFRVTYIQKATGVLKNVYRRVVPTRWVLLAAGFLLTFDAFKHILATTECTPDLYLYNWQRLDFLSHVILGVILIVMFWSDSY